MTSSFLYISYTDLKFNIYMPSTIAAALIAAVIKSQVLPGTYIEVLTKLQRLTRTDVV